MKRNGQTHPARSVEFLSRLHDGELDAGERARFESHRTHCAECRRSVMEFEDAISLFRSARSSPPRSDLAGRILRKVQSTNRPRTPFPRRFQIDLGWTVLMLTALFAVLFMTPILVRKNPAATSPPPPTPGPRPPIIVQLPRPDSSAPRHAPETRRRAEDRLADARPAASQQSREDAPAASAVAAPPKAEPGAGRPRAPSAPAEARKSTAGIAAAAPEPPAGGGETDASARLESATPPLRLSVREADGFGAPPALRTVPRMALPPSERGREYLVLVDPQGIVRGVTADPEVSRALSRIHFEAGPRARRLLVRVE
jgi:Putative zinc-finger